MWLPFGLKGKYFGEKTSFLESPCKAEQGMMSPANSDTVESLRSSSFRPKEARNTVCIFSDANGKYFEEQASFLESSCEAEQVAMFPYTSQSSEESSFLSFNQNRGGNRCGSYTLQMGELLGTVSIP